MTSKSRGEAIFLRYSSIADCPPKRSGQGERQARPFLKGTQCTRSIRMAW